MAAQIKVLAFDLDDTLWDMVPTLLRAERTLHDWLREHCPRNQYDMVAMRNIRAELLDEDPALAHRVSDLRRGVICRALEKSGYSAADAASLGDAAFEVFLAARNDVFFFDDALPTVALLAQRYTLGALTNGNSDIARLGLGAYFSFAFTAEKVGRPKPAPDLFLAALAHTGVRPGEMAYVGDHPEQDIAAAHRAGLRTIWVNIRANAFTGAVVPDQEVRQLRDLPGAVARLSAPAAS